MTAKITFEVPGTGSIDAQIAIICADTMQNFACGVSCMGG
jgi:hypothetical protein